MNSAPEDKVPLDPKFSSRRGDTHLLTISTFAMVFIVVLLISAAAVALPIMENKQKQKHYSTEPGVISTHVLDTSVGNPAGNVLVSASILQGGVFKKLSQKRTTADGRIDVLVGGNSTHLEKGSYKLHFNVGEYFEKQGNDVFFPYIETVFIVNDPDQSYHIPILINPYGYSTYKVVNTEEQTITNKTFDRDPNGYLIFCLCMGRYGNQAEHFLGGVAFAKAINRTLIIPPWRTYINVEYDEWFEVGPLEKFHRVILAKDFMKELAHEVWPPGKRFGFCYQMPNQPECKMKNGNPFTNFWDELHVDFDRIIGYQLSHQNPKAWIEQFSGDKYPVIALRGAPASFPMLQQHLPIQSFMEFSEHIKHEGESVLKKLFGQISYDYVAIHLRNGEDWIRACDHIGPSSPKFMASYQCQGWDYSRALTKEMCLPSEKTIVKLTKKIMQKTGLRKLLVATDKNPMIKEFRNALPDVTVVHSDPWLPVVDAYLLSNSKYFIGNCVSSFSAFAWRHRQSHGNLPTSHFGFDS